MNIKFVKKGESFLHVKSAHEVIFETTLEHAVKHAVIMLFAIVQFLMYNGLNEVQIEQNVDKAIGTYKKFARTEKQVKN